MVYIFMLMSYPDYTLLFAKLASAWRIGWGLGVAIVGPMPSPTVIRPHKLYMALDETILAVAYLVVVALHPGDVTLETGECIVIGLASVACLMREPRQDPRLAAHKNHRTYKVGWMLVRAFRLLAFDCLADPFAQIIGRTVPLEHLVAAESVMHPTVRKALTPLFVLTIMLAIFYPRQGVGVDRIFRIIGFFGRHAGTDSFFAFRMLALAISVMSRCDSCIASVSVIIHETPRYPPGRSGPSTQAPHHRTSLAGSRFALTSHMLRLLRSRHGRAVACVVLRVHVGCGVSLHLAGLAAGCLLFGRRVLHHHQAVDGPEVAHDRHDLILAGRIIIGRFQRRLLGSEPGLPTCHLAKIGHVSPRLAHVGRRCVYPLLNLILRSCIAHVPVLFCGCPRLMSLCPAVFEPASPGQSPALYH